MSLPPLQGQITLENLVIAVPGRNEPILNGVTLMIEPGTTVALIGPSAAGKSTLARAMLGLYTPARGRVCLDGADVHNWDRTQLGQYVGYLPQDVELLDGTVAENIARFGQIEADRVVEAARSCGDSRDDLDLATGLRHAIDWSAASPSRPGNSNASGLPGRSTDARAWWCSMNPMRTSTWPGKPRS